MPGKQTIIRPRRAAASTPAGLGRGGTVVRAEAAVSGLDSLVFAVRPALLRSVEFRSAGRASPTEVSRELQDFEYRATRGGVALEQVDAVRSVLADVFNGDAVRGAAQIERLAQDPTARPDVLEALHHCICVGFAGQLALERLERLEQDLYARFGEHRDVPADLLSPVPQADPEGFSAVGPRITARSMLLAPLVIAARAFDRLRPDQAAVYPILGSRGSGKSLLARRLAAGAGAQCVFIEATANPRSAAPLISGELRPGLCGVVVVLDVTDILDSTHGPRTSGVPAIRQQLRHLDTMAGAHLPVYAVLTKADRIPGFTEYFAGLDDRDRVQPWGMTFDLRDSHSGRALRTLPVTFDAMTARLHRGLTRRLHEVQRCGDRERLYAFPRRVAALKTGILGQVEQLAGATPGTVHHFLRGVYMTSSGAVESDRGWFVDALARDVLLPERAIVRRSRWHLKW